MGWHSVVGTTGDLCGQSLHALRSERRQKRYHFVEDAAQAPDVARVVVWLIFPDFWTGVVRRSRLSREQALLGDLGHIQVAELEHSGFGEEEVRALDVSVDYFEVMKCLETSDDLNEVVPDLFLSELGPPLLVLLDRLQEIATISQLHDDAQAALLVLEEGLLVADNVWVVD